MMIRSALFLAGAVTLAACASAPSTGANKATSAPPRIETEAPDPDPLRAASIPSGRCGMILWTKSGSRTLPIFRSLDNLQATMQIEGDEVSLDLQEEAGELRLGMRSEQLYAVADEARAGSSVETKLTWGQTFPGGSYISGGTITLTGADGWQRILPVAGIAGCKA
ncbi:hypothetical protein HK107_12295 [Parvularcula sp. ZS-1/3]|uniref:Lipoprotein n=1 Tax=Parvularcula mediterranea TaxID=2732508 RepID=A0A7Y3RN13_9PROT|nr:hypothetical protein [Parvularcula mediterranea]NNU17102.1 hypothetical protein [Parvularcula mediterranea]